MMIGFKECQQTGVISIVLKLIYKAYHKGKFLSRHKDNDSNYIIYIDKDMTGVCHIYLVKEVYMPSK